MWTRRTPGRSSDRFAAAVLLSLTTLAAISGSAAGAEQPKDVMGLSPQIERFLEERVPLNLPRSGRLQALMDALFGHNGLDVAYGNLETKTAPETFATRSGNCLSFTILFVAMARHVGLEAHFQEVSEILSWDRRGDVAVSNRHMFAEVETAAGRVRVDFLPGVDKRYRSVQQVDEQRVLAHYYNNLGAEALTGDDLDRAMSMFAKALAADGTLAATWVNMGVTQRRLGRLEDAEASYLRALELEPGEVSAASNLAGLYRFAGRPREAAPYLARVKRHRRSNPFWHFRVGLDAAVRGDLRAAARSLKKAVRLMPDDPLFLTELGKVQKRSGNLRRAERNYIRALQLATDEEQRQVLEALLRQLRAADVQGAALQAFAASSKS